MLVGFELGALVALHSLGDLPFLRVPFGDLTGWLAVTPPEDALAAVVRLLALGCAWWLAGSTALYTLARLSRVPGAIRATERATLPGVRRVADRAVAVTLTATTVAGVGGPAAAATPPPPGAAAARTHPAAEQVDDGLGPSVPRPGAAAGAAATEAGSSEHSGPPGATGGDSAGKGSKTPRASEAPRRTAPPTRHTGRSAGQSESPQPAGQREIDHQAIPQGQRNELSGQGELSHRVEDGENLWALSAERLAASTGREEQELSNREVHAYWVRVVEANRGELDSGDPSVIYPGESVVLPSVPSR
jgi:hypothetical protein